MPQVIEKGMINTGFDDIADTIDKYSLTYVAYREDGHHEPSAVAQAITNFQPKMVSKTCKVQQHDADDYDNYIPPKLVIGGLEVPLKKKNSSGTWVVALEGDIYVDKQGNITTS